MFSESKLIATLCMNVYRFAAVSANGRPASDVSISTCRSYGVIHSPGDTTLLVMEKRVNNESEPHKPHTARWFSRFLFHPPPSLVQLLSTHAPSAFTLASVFSVYSWHRALGERFWLFNKQLTWATKTSGRWHSAVRYQSTRYRGEREQRPLILWANPKEVKKCC